MGRCKPLYLAPGSPFYCTETCMKKESFFRSPKKPPEGAKGTVVLNLKLFLYLFLPLAWGWLAFSLGLACRRLRAVPLNDWEFLQFTWGALLRKQPRKGRYRMDKIKMTTPLVEMDGDEMTRILW